MPSKTTLFSALSKNAKLFTGLAAATLLSACGGGSDLKKGTFMKGQVSGLAYTTETQSGVTDSQGRFQYKNGETVRFFIGGTQLGMAVAAANEVGPLDLAPGAVIPETPREVKDFFDTHWQEFGENPAADATNELMNILRFLYSADSDKLASNGVSITPATHTTFANNSYDLKINAYAFSNIDGIRYKFYEAYHAAAMDSARIISQWKALDDFAALEGFSPQVMVRHTSSYDSDADGVIDSSHTNNFDERRLYAGYNNSNGDYENLVYNDYGEWMSAEGSGEGTWRYWVVRDIHGKPLEYHADENDDGVSDHMGTLTYDDMGNRLSESIDEDADGVIDSIYTFTYDANGNETSNSYDADADGTPERIYTYTYDANGNQTMQANDSDGDGTPNRIATYTYDANGNQTMYAYDSDGDGNPERIHIYAYDADGHQILYSYDSNGDGSPERITTYTYDADGNQILRAYDSNADGAPDILYAYTYNAAGQQLTYTRDNGADGSINYAQINTYDADGNQTSRGYDNEGDGVIDRIYTYQYDANGNRVHEEYDSNNDGTPERIYTYEYDEFGNRTRYERDNDGDGVLDRVTTYTYQVVDFLGWSTWDDF